MGFRVKKERKKDLDDRINGINEGFYEAKVDRSGSGWHHLRSNDRAQIALIKSKIKFAPPSALTFPPSPLLKFAFLAVTSTKTFTYCF